MERTEQDRRGVAAINNFAATIGAWLLWVAVCGMAYWGYWDWAGDRGRAVSISLSLIFWGNALVVTPILVYRNRDPLGQLMLPIMMLLAYHLMITQVMTGS